MVIIYHFPKHPAGRNDNAELSALLENSNIENQDIINDSAELSALPETSSGEKLILAQMRQLKKIQILNMRMLQKILAQMRQLPKHPENHGLRKAGRK